MRMTLLLLLACSLGAPPPPTPKSLFPRACAALVLSADQHAERPVRTVQDKTGCAPNGDKREYYSLSPYWWPNPDTPDGLPYVQRDGEVNPEAYSDNYDRSAYFQMTDAIVHSALAYSLEQQIKHAETAARWARAWFVSEETAMRPRFAYGQGIPGKEDGRPEAIIRGIALLDIDAVLHRLPIDVWTEADREALSRWQDEYFDWLTTSELGQRESRAFNNHGTWYDVQAVAFAHGPGSENFQRGVLSAAAEKRIRRQIQPDGRMNFELLRTKSWDYATMNLDALTRLAAYARPMGIDLWGYTTDKGASIRAALEYLLPYVYAPDTWPHKQIAAFEPERLVPALRRFLAAHPNEEQPLRQALDLLEVDTLVVAVDWLLHPYHKKNIIVGMALPDSHLLPSAHQP